MWSYRGLRLFGQTTVAIDRGTLNAVNSRDRRFAPGRVAKQEEHIEASIRRYLTARATASRSRSAKVAKNTTAGLRQWSSTMRERKQRMNTMGEDLHQPDSHISPDDPGACAMISQAKGTEAAGCNVQAELNTQHHLIVTHWVSNAGIHRMQFTNKGGWLRPRSPWASTNCMRLPTGAMSAPRVQGLHRGRHRATGTEGDDRLCPAVGRSSKTDLVYIAADHE